MLWDVKQIENFEGNINDIIAVTNIKINEFNGIKNLSLQYSTINLINPEISETQK